MSDQFANNQPGSKFCQYLIRVQVTSQGGGTFVSPPQVLPIWTIFNAATFTHRGKQGQPAVWRQNTVEILLVTHLLMFLWSWSFSIWFVPNCKLVLSKIRIALLWEKQKVEWWVLFANEEIRDWTENGNQSRQFLTNCLMNPVEAPTFHIAPEQSHSPQ